MDAEGYLALGQIYTANMSGNSIAIGIRAFEQNWPETLRRCWPVASYVAGLLAARILLEFAGREKVRSVAAIAFTIEIVALASVTFGHDLPHSQIYSPLSFEWMGLLAFAMGIQNATLTHFSSLTINTGFVTGTLVKFAEQFTKYLTWGYDRIRNEHLAFAEVLRETARQKEFRLAFLLACLWICYVVGAICGSAGHWLADLKALWVPVGALFVLALYDLRKPIAGKDEKEQLAS